ncbi:MAG: ABC transporter permease [Alistipes sp.]|nr:ABC transporter permease [Alistipes sp.]
MQVFNVFMKIAKSKLGVAVLFVMIMVAVGLLNGGTSDNSSESFVSTKITAAVIDEDNSEASRALTDFIASTHTLTEVENDEEVILDKLFYQKVQYVLIIKEGYGEKLAKGETSGLFENYKDPNTFYASFFESTLNEYVSAVRGCTASGDDMTSALEKGAELASAKVNVKIENGGSEETLTGGKTRINIMYKSLTFVLVAVLVDVLCPILLVLKGEEVRKRMESSCLSATSQTLQIFLGCAVYTAGLWALVNFILFAVNGFAFTSRECLHLVNSFVFALVSAGIALLVTSLKPAENVINVIGISISLGMSFLCGAFVPLSLLGDGILTVSRFLPAYWYVRASEIITAPKASSDAKNLLICFGIQLLFAAALFALVLVISRAKHGRQGGKA